MRQTKKSLTFSEIPLVEPIMTTAARMEAIADQYIFRPLGLTTSTGKILKALLRHRTTTPGDLLRIVGGTKSNITQRLDILEKRGYVSRKHGEKKDGDKRQVQVALTAEGKRKIKAVEVRIRHANICLEEYFGKEELERHFDFFRKLNGILDESETHMKTRCTR